MAELLVPGNGVGAPVLDPQADDSPVVINGVQMPVHRALTALVMDIQRRTVSIEQRLGEIADALSELLKAKED